ncbi:MAG: DNA translocase FtsK [Pirellulales bacterium]
MFEQRNLHKDIFALGLLALVVFLGLSLLTYRSSDPIGEMSGPLSLIYTPNPVVYPPTTVTYNACGGMGALTADILFTYFGWGAFYVVLSLGIVNALLLMRKEIDSASLRLIGWLLSFVGITALAAMVLPGSTAGTITGPGGYLGIVGQGLLHHYFATAGSLILAMTMVVAGLLLCTEYEIFRISAVCTAKAIEGFLVTREKVNSRFGKNEEEYEEEEGDEEELQNENEMTIKIGGRTILEDGSEEGAEPEVAEEETEEEFEDEEEDEYEEESELEEEEELVDDEEEEIPIKKPAAKEERTYEVKNSKSKKQQQEDERLAVMNELNAASDEDDELVHYELPPIDLLVESDEFSFDEQEKEVRIKAKKIEQTFGNFGFNVKVVEIETGPVIAQYEVELEAGLRLSKITGLSDDLAIALRVPSVRIVAPIPGKNTVGIEVPNEERQMVRLREVMEEANGRANKMKIPIFLGKDVSGNSLVVDLASLPHLLIAGRTGTGKSVCLNAIISSMLMTRKPDEVRMLMIDPKMVELSCYRSLPHLMHPVVTDMKKAEAILAWAVEKMEERYQLLARAGVRHLSVYNQLDEEELMERLEVGEDEDRENVPKTLPYIVIVADEIADLMMTAGKEVEQHIIRLAQKSRAVGIHLILATQKPTVDVITGLIKSNLPARLAFQVASRTDSRVVLDEMGADKLLGNGDMLFLWPGTSSLLRGQGTYLSDDEINSVVDFVSTGEQDFVKELVQLKIEDGAVADPSTMKKRDDLYEQAVAVIVSEQRGSVSLLQRNLGIGYGRGARLIDFMAEDGIVGPYNGSQAREVLISAEEWESMQAGGGGPAPIQMDDAEPPKPKKKRTNKIIPIRDKEESEETLADHMGSSSKKRKKPKITIAETIDEDEPNADEEFAVEDEELETAGSLEADLDEDYEEDEAAEDEELVEEEELEEDEYEDEVAEDDSESDEEEEEWDEDEVEEEAAEYEEELDEDEELESDEPEEEEELEEQAAELDEEEQEDDEDLWDEKDEKDDYLEESA